MNRRAFLGRTVIGAVLGATGAFWWRTTHIGQRGRAPVGLKVLSPDEATTLAAVAARIVAPLDAERQGVVRKVDQILFTADDVTQHDLKQLLRLFDNPLASLAFDGRWTPFTALAPEAQDEALAQWRDSRIPDRRSGFQALQRLCLAVTYADRGLYAAIGYPGPPVLVRTDGTAVGGDEE